MTLALRSTLITGFPGETDDEFETLLRFVRAARFRHLGVFTYSHEERTPAFTMEDDVDPAKDDFMPAVADAFTRYARFNECAEITLTRASSQTPGDALRNSLQA